MDELNFLSPSVYEDLSHYSIIPIKATGSYTFDPKILYNNAIIFCKTDYIPYLFNYLKNSWKKYILITHQSDYAIDIEHFLQKPHNVKKWFGINVVYKHQDLIPIPTGLLTHRGEHKNGYDPLWLIDNAERLQNKEKNTEEVYCNWSVTNPSRKSIIDKLNAAGIKCKIESGLSFKDYCENMSNYKFVISPYGNGIDGQRTYEALYAGCIPIVIKHYIYDNWNELPIIQVKDYSEVTYELLHSYLNKEYNMEKLYMSYWKKKIYDEFNNLN